MAVHLLDDFALGVEDSSGSPPPCLARLLSDLSFHCDTDARSAPTAVIHVDRVAAGVGAPASARPLFQLASLCAFEDAGDVYLTVQAAVMRVPRDGSIAGAWIAPQFFDQDVLVRQRFWAYGVTRLLRARGLFALHAATIVSPGGAGVIVAGASGSGKSTLAIGLIRSGWSFLSDDAVLLRHTPAAVDALALRVPFSIDSDASGRYADLRLGAAARGQKRRADLHATHASQYRARCTPCVLVFPHIIRAPRSSLQPLTRAATLGRLLEHSGPVLFDRRTMSEHLATLRDLAVQAPAYDLCAGADVHADPAVVIDLLRTAEGSTVWPG